MSDDEGPADPARIEALFTRADGRFLFARWGRPPVPAVFGTDEAGARVFAEALASVGGLTGFARGAADPELGANVLVFFCTDWADLKAVPHLGRLILDLDRLASVLAGAGANQYRIFGFDEAGAIRLCLILLRYDDDLRRVSAQALAVSQSVQSLLLWSDAAFTAEAPVALVEGGRAVVKPWHAAVIRAAYDPRLPARSEDATLALRIAARVQDG